MAKKGLSLSQRKKILSERSKKGGWTLCVGAGVSRGAFPDWKSLVVKLASDDCNEAQAGNLISVLSEEFSLDALVQTAQNRLSLKSEEFASLLSKNLFQDIKEQLGKDWHLAAKALSALTPGDLKPTQWSEFIQIVKKNYPNISSLAVARVIGDSIGKDIAPTSIISFNAETLLYALITAEVGKNGSSKGGTIHHQKKALDRVTRSLSSRYSIRIPYFHCHGILPIPDGTDRFHREIGIDKLVFAEGEYLRLSNDSFSWQSSVFLSACSFQSIVFLGVSLADSNMRRWLSWVHQNKTDELKLLGDNSDSTNHFWIKVEPKDKHQKAWIEASVAHLGVRLVWINEWGETETCLREMMGID